MIFRANGGSCKIIHCLQSAESWNRPKITELYISFCAQAKIALKIIENHVFIKKIINK